MSLKGRAVSKLNAFRWQAIRSFLRETRCYVADKTRELL